jgi:hypothetical protein
MKAHQVLSATTSQCHGAWRKIYLFQDLLFEISEHNLAGEIFGIENWITCEFATMILHACQKGQFLLELEFSGVILPQIAKAIRADLLHFLFLWRCTSSIADRRIF